MQENKKGKKNTPPLFFFFLVFKVLLIYADFPAAKQDASSLLFTQSANPQFLTNMYNFFGLGFKTYNLFEISLVTSVCHTPCSVLVRPLYRLRHEQKKKKRV